MSVAASNPAIAIPNLLYTYAELFDAGEFEQVAHLFDQGGVIVDGRKIEGAENIQAMWMSYVHLYPGGTPLTRHLVNNPIIALADDTQSAACRSQWTVLQATDALPLQMIGTGRYEDEFALVDGEWAFAWRDYSKVDFWGDTSAHLKPALGHGDR